MDILKISVLGTAGVLLGILLKDRAPEYVSLVTMGREIMRVELRKAASIPRFVIYTIPFVGRIPAW